MTGNFGGLSLHCPDMNRYNHIANFSSLEEACLASYFLCSLASFLIENFTVDFYISSVLIPHTKGVNLYIINKYV
jgi:hypothetical protein